MDSSSLKGLLEEHAQLEEQLADPSVHADQARARKLGRRYAELSPVVKTIRELDAAREDLEAAKELERAKKLGLVAGLLPAVTWLQKGYGHTDFDPIYEAAERLDIPLTVHGAPSRGMGFDFFKSFSTFTRSNIHLRS